jgi:hypothetical protein
MSTVRRQLIVKNTPVHGADYVPILNRPIKITMPRWLIILCAFFLMPTTIVWSGEVDSVNQEELLTTIREYAHAPVENGETAVICGRKFS